MNGILQSKKTLIVILVLLAGFLVYQFVLKKEDPASSEFLLQETFNPADVIIGRDLLMLLAKMRTTKIDETVFKDPAWEKLEDFSRPIPEQPIERVNPFAPVGIEGGAVVTPAPASSGARPSGNEESSFPFIP